MRIRMVHAPIVWCLDSLLVVRLIILLTPGKFEFIAVHCTFFTDSFWLFYRFRFCFRSRSTFSSAGYGFNGWGACTACPGGTASPEGSTQPCISCLPGQFAYPISASCTPCFANTFAIGSGSTTCASCPSGQVSPIGASGCSTCFTGTYSTGPNTCK